MNEEPLPPSTSHEVLLTEFRVISTRLDARRDTIDGRLDTLTSNLSSLCVALNDLPGKVATNESRLTEAESRISAVEESTGAHGSGWRKNIKIVGLPKRAEDPVPLSKFLHEILPKWLDLPSDFASEMEHSHRSLALDPPERSPPWSVLVRFLCYSGKEPDLRAALQKRQVMHEGNQLRFYQDLSADVLRRRRKFSEVRKEFSERQMF
ncbi:hypothetical protein AOLI_G00217610 [Acnodon oligacanthus]